MQTELNSRQRARMRGLAMNLKCSSSIGRAGLTAGAIKEISAALDREELIKVRVSADDRETRAAVMGEIATRTEACLCGATGGVAVYFRPSKKHLVDPGE